MKDLKKLKLEIAQVERQLKAAKEALSKLYSTRKALHAQSRFSCKKCGLAFRDKELGYRDWEVLRTKLRYLPMGDYDTWQVEETQHIACCPKCGKDFGIPVWYSDYSSSTPHYSRWEDKPDFQKEYKKPVDKKIRKVTPKMVKYLSEIHYDY
jgi:hypothetical protein